MKNEYIYRAEIIDAKTDKLLIRLVSYSQESLEEEMGKTKWTEAIVKYEASNSEEEAMDAELEADNLADKKLEELDADTLEENL